MYPWISRKYVTVSVSRKKQKKTNRNSFISIVSGNEQRESSRDTLYNARKPIRKIILSNKNTDGPAILTRCIEAINQLL